MFYIYRIFLFIFIAIICFIALKKARKLGQKNTSLLLLFVILGYLISTSLPVEQSFVRFRTPEESFRYSNNSRSLIKTIQDDDFAVVVYDNNGKLSFTVANKDKTGWLLCNDVNQVFSDSIDQYSITVVKSYSSKNMVIAMFPDYGDSGNRQINVQDKMQSSFHYNQFKFMQYTFKVGYTVINSYPSNYTLTVNGLTKALSLK